MHYTPDGTERTDRTKIGLIFSKQPPKERIFNIGLNNTSLMIPPGDPHHRVDTYVTLPNELTLVDITPHMHFRGSGLPWKQPTLMVKLRAWLMCRTMTLTGR